MPHELMVNAHHGPDGMMNTSRSSVDYMVFGMFQMGESGCVLDILYDELAKFEHLFRTVGGLMLYLAYLHSRATVEMMP
jgi:hypothetical protein